MNETAFALTIGAAFFWAFSWTIPKLTTGTMNPITFNTVQSLFLVAVMTPLVFLTGMVLGSNWAVLMAATYGFLWVFLGSQVFYYCLKIAPAHFVIPVCNTHSVWTVIFAALLLGEGIGLAVPLALGFIIVGLLLMASQKKSRTIPTTAIILSVLVAMSFGLTQIIRKSALMSGIGGLTLLWIASLVGLPLLAITGLLRSSFKGQVLSRYNITISTSAGFINVLLGGMFFLMALSIEDAHVLGIVTSAVIPFSFAMSIILLRERPAWRATVGAILTFIGVIIAAL